MGSWFEIEYGATFNQYLHIEEAIDVEYIILLKEFVVNTSSDGEHDSILKDLELRISSITKIQVDVNSVKVRFCMALFDAVSSNDIFQDVLDAFYDETFDKKTLDYM